jgi:hypothetical protein
MYSAAKEPGRAEKGDQMRLWKSRPKCGPTHFSLNSIHNFYRGKSSPKSLGPFCHMQKTTQIRQSPKWAKIRPIWSPWCRVGGLNKSYVDVWVAWSVPESTATRNSQDLLKDRRRRLAGWPDAKKAQNVAQSVFGRN